MPPPLLIFSLRDAAAAAADADADIFLFVFAALPLFFRRWLMVTLPPLMSAG
jgi:hypothetical protein